VYNREIDGQVLTLAASGWTYEFVFVLYDHETESMWKPVNVGEAGIGCGCVLWCFAGQYAGRFLPALQSENTIWATWFADHPDTRIMAADPSLQGGPAGTCTD